MTNLLKSLDYSVLQQCMHCGMCLPTCPTYAETSLERHSPRGRIALMRAIADDDLPVTKTFAEEMYYCLGCLACVSACPAGVDYAELFEVARTEVERTGVMDNPVRNFVRWSVLRVLFTRPRLLRLLARVLRFYQASGLQSGVRRAGLTRILPVRLRSLERQTPVVQRQFSNRLIAPIETPRVPRRYRVAVLTGCVQDIVFSNINRATVDVLRENGCEVHTPPLQPCCGSLHAHNGDIETARTLARRLLDQFPPQQFDAIITNAGGCGSHLRHFGELLRDDPLYTNRAALWSARVRDIHEWLVQIGFRRPVIRNAAPTTVTYHESCHLCHGQRVTRQPREILSAIPGVELRECKEANWCCGSAGIYNITQPETAARLQDRKLQNLRNTGASIAATANPGCHLQIENALTADDSIREVAHPITLLARAYAVERGQTHS